MVKCDKGFKVYRCSYQECDCNFMATSKRYYKYCSVLCANRDKNHGQHQIDAVNKRWGKI